MRYNSTSKLLIVALCGLAYTPAFAFYVNVVESRVSGGAQNPLFAFNGVAVTSAKSTAAPLAGWTGGTLTGTGNYYAGQTTPAKWGEWSFTPGVGLGGYYDVYATWTVNTYAAAVPPPLWTVNNAGSAVTINVAQTGGGNAWSQLAVGLKFDAGTAYKTRLTTVPDNASGKRTYFDSVAWAASQPGVVTYSSIIPDDATDIPLTGAGNDLSWTAGSFNSFFDVWFGTTSGSLTKIGSALSETTLTFDLDGQNLQAGTEYFWRIEAGNVDRATAGPEYSFTTAAVPEPSSALVGLLGGLGIFAWINRRRAV